MKNLLIAILIGSSVSITSPLTNMIEATNKAIIEMDGITDIASVEQLNGAMNRMRIAVDELLGKTTKSVVKSKSEKGGKTVITLWNDSFVAYNVAKNYYEFTPIECGDWNYELDNIKDLENLVKTYVNINYYNGEY